MNVLPVFKRGEQEQKAQVIDKTANGTLGRASLFLC